MLSTEEISEIEAEAAHYPRRDAVSIDAMRIVQRHRGWVSDESLHDIAVHLGMSVTDLDSVATFYNLIFRKPVGRHVIMICDSVSCWMMGYDRLREHLGTRLGVGLGETTPDNRFTLLPIVCLGCCDRAPAMMVDDDLHSDLDVQKIDRALEGLPTDEELQWIGQGKRVVFVDAREPVEFDEEHIPGAVNVSLAATSFESVERSTTRKPNLAAKKSLALSVSR